MKYLSENETQTTCTITKIETTENPNLDALTSRINMMPGYYVRSGRESGRRGDMVERRDNELP